MKFIISKLLKPKGKWGFLSTFYENPKILDVGCGCASVIGTKNLCPNSTYYGIDIGDYGQTEYSKSLIDKYIISSPDNFHKAILDINQEFDVVISSHNLEHCNYRELVLEAMMNKVKKGGKIFLSFPTEKSINFPKRPALNYYTDKTHKSTPPKSKYVINELKKNNFEILFFKKRYRPIIFFLIGLILEPISIITKRCLKGTWELYGMETIIHAKKLF